MAIDDIPALYFGSQSTPDIWMYDLKMNAQVIKTKVNLNMHMFSFLRAGSKQIHFSNNIIKVNNSQSLLLKSGNSLWTEILDHSDNYYCKLLFFTDEVIQGFIKTHLSKSDLNSSEDLRFFSIANDEYIKNYIASLDYLSTDVQHSLLKAKLDELLLYLLEKYGDRFIVFLQSLTTRAQSSFQQTISQNVYTSLNTEELAFLCNMSLSTFKRHFRKNYNSSPGIWLRNKRLEKAYELLESEVRPSDMYMQLGYNNLSNFSIAFKQKYNLNPTEVPIKKFKE